MPNHWFQPADPSLGPRQIIESNWFRNLIGHTHIREDQALPNETKAATVTQDIKIETSTKPKQISPSPSIPTQPKLLKRGNT